MRERQGLDDGISAVMGLEQALEDNVGLIELGEAEGDQAIVAEAEAAIRTLSGEVRREPDRDACCRAKRMAMTPISKSMPAPAAPKARTGPTMLLRMYTRWAERRGFKVEVLEEHDGEEAGIKSAQC